MLARLNELFPLFVLSYFSLGLIGLPQQVDCLAGFNVLNYANIVRNAVFVAPTSTLVKQAGYESTIYNLPTQPGYVINLIQISNPKIPKERLLNRTVLFVHGLFQNANAWLAMGVSNGMAHDWSQLDAAKMSIVELEKLTEDDMTSRSLPFLMSNFGYDVWLMNRRNNIHSRSVSPIAKKSSDIKPMTSRFQMMTELARMAKDLAQTTNNNNNNPRETPNSGESSRASSLVEPTTPKATLTIATTNTNATLGDQAQDARFIPIEPKSPLHVHTLPKLYIDMSIFKNTANDYFDFSYDEQAKYDIPMVIDFVLKISGRSKLDFVGHSAGALILFQMISMRPEMATKINHAAMMAPAVHLRYMTMKNVLYKLLVNFETQLSMGVGSLDFIDLMPSLFVLGTPLCLRERLAGYPCIFIDESLGLGTKQLDSIVAFGNYMTHMCEASFHEIAQLLQTAQKNQIQFFDYRRPEKNVAIYGSLIVPKYDLTKVCLNSTSIWHGNTDRLVDQYDTFSLMEDLKIPFDFHMIGNMTQGIYFNHLAFMFHRKITKLLNVPILKRISQVR